MAGQRSEGVRWSHALQGPVGPVALQCPVRGNGGRQERRSCSNRGGREVSWKKSIVFSPFLFRTISLDEQDKFGFTKNSYPRKLVLGVVYKGTGDTCTNRKWHTHLLGSHSVCLPVGNRKVVVVTWSRILGDGRRIRGCMFTRCVEEGGTDVAGVVLVFSSGVGNQSYVVRGLRSAISREVAINVVEGLGE